MLSLSVAIIARYSPDIEYQGKDSRLEQKKLITGQLSGKNDIVIAQLGVASWYDYDLNRKDQKCLDENCYSMFNATCASRLFKRGSILKVTNLENLKSVECRVNDWVDNEDVIIDLSSYAFNKLFPLSRGVMNVEVEIIR